MVLKRWNPGCCCTPDTGDPCALFTDEFDRADSDTVGNGWGGSGDFNVHDEKLEGFSGTLDAPVGGRISMSISCWLYFSQNNQTAKIYYGGSNYYVGVTPSSSDPTKRNLFIVYNGTIRAISFATVNSKALTGVAPPVGVFICVTSTTITAYAGGQGVFYSPIGGVSIGGAVGVGVEGGIENGPVMFDRFYVNTISDACYDCTPDDCSACSGNYSWMLDLTSFNGHMTQYWDTSSPADCSACASGWGIYLLEGGNSNAGLGSCSWSYFEEFCPGASYLGGACTPIYLSLNLRVTYGGGDDMPCQAHLTIGLKELGSATGTDSCIPGFPYEQAISYDSPANAAATNGSGVITLRKNPGLTNGAFQTTGFIYTPPCPASVTRVGGVLVDLDYYFPPEELVLSRVA